MFVELVPQERSIISGPARPNTKDGKFYKCISLINSMSILVSLMNTR